MGTSQLQSRKTFLLAIAVIVLLNTWSSARAQSPSVFVVAGPGISLSGADVKEVFFGDKTFSGSTKLVPIDNTALREVFLNKALGISGPKYESVWVKKGFRDAINPPRVLSSDAEVVDFVKRTPGAVGYVSTRPTGMTVIQGY